MQRIWFPGLCALMVVGGLYWYFFGVAGPGIMSAPKTAAELFAEQSAAQTDEKAIDSNKADTNKKPLGPERPTAQGNDSSFTNNSNTQNIMNAILHTNMGDITIQFNPNTPNTTANFIKLAKEGFYNGTKFHRVIKGFMNQAGDPLTKDDKLANRWGTGGPGYQFADEISESNNNAPGTIAMANSGPNTNGSQFFINVADNSFLNTKHTVFGVVTVGAEVVVAMNEVKTGENDRPLEPIIITSIDLK